MLPRICEPELMDEPGQAHAYADADFSGSDQALVQRIQARFGDDLGPQIVDLGCGPGNITFLLARCFPRSQVMGIDGSRAMLAIAGARLQADPELSIRLRFQQITLPATDLPGGFSALVSNSLLHHLHNPQVLWSSLRQLGGSGAAVSVTDLRRPGERSELEELVKTHMGQAPDVLRRDYRHSLHAAFTRREVLDQLRAADLGCLEVIELKDRYLEIRGRLD